MFNFFLLYREKKNNEKKTVAVYIFLLDGLCTHTHTRARAHTHREKEREREREREREWENEMWRFAFCMHLQFAPANQVVLKDDNWFQAPDQFKFSSS